MNVKQKINCEVLGFDPTNHHNAAKCPYCRPVGGDAVQKAVTELKTLSLWLGRYDDRMNPNQIVMRLGAVINMLKPE